MTIILYDMAIAKDASVVFNSNTWRTRYCLNLKGLAHKTVWIERPDIEAHHIKLGIAPTSKKADGSPLYTIPAIYDPSTGKYVADSFKIALYLDETYPDAPRILHKESTALQLAFADSFPEIISALNPFLLAASFSLYGERTRLSAVGPAEKLYGKKVDEIEPRGEVGVTEWAKVKAGLGKVDSWYAASGGPFLLGNEASWADFVVSAYLKWPLGVLGENSEKWKDISSWHDGRWKRLVDSLSFSGDSYANDRTLAVDPLSWELALSGDFPSAIAFIAVSTYERLQFSERCPHSSGSGHATESIGSAATSSKLRTASWALNTSFAQWSFYVYSLKPLHERACYHGYLVRVHQPTEEMLPDDEKNDLSITTVGVESVVHNKWTQRLATWGVELRGIQPVPKEERTDTEYNKICWVFFSSNMNILAFSAGTLGPAVFELGVRDSCLVILGFNAVCAIFPAYFATWGSGLGMRQMILARYSFGYYGVILLCVLNLLCVFGISVLDCILGGQALSSVTNGRMSWTVGIVVFTLLSVVVSFCGYKFLTWYERVAWIPVVITFVIILAIGGKHLGNPTPPVPPTITSILGFAGTQAGFTITWSGFAADYAIYLRPNHSSWRIFWYSYIGLFLPTALMACVGAALSGVADSVPAWKDGYAGGNVGGLLEAVLQPAGGFGKFLTVLLSLSVASSLVSIFYSASFNFQVFIPRLVVVPRYIFTLVTAAVVLPISIVGAHRFYATITNFLSLIGYWSSAFVSILIMEHLFFRSNSFSEYDIEAWNVPSRLPTGFAAIGAALLAFVLVVPSVSQVWFTGPIAKTTGDLGFEVALVLSAILYPPLRWLEIRIRGRV